MLRIVIVILIKPIDLISMSLYSKSNKHYSLLYEALKEHISLHMCSASCCVMSLLCLFRSINVLYELNKDSNNTSVINSSREAARAKNIHAEDAFI
jgi:hypothetical protein